MPWSFTLHAAVSNALSASNAAVDYALNRSELPHAREEAKKAIAAAFAELRSIEAAEDTAREFAEWKSAVASNRTTKGFDEWRKGPDLG